MKSRHRAVCGPRCVGVGPGLRSFLIVFARSGVICPPAKVAGRMGVPEVLSMELGCRCFRAGSPGDPAGRTPG